MIIRILTGFFELYLSERENTLEEAVELWGTEVIKRCVMEKSWCRLSATSDCTAATLGWQAGRVKRAGIGAAISVSSLRHKNRWITPAAELFLQILKEQLNAAEPD